MADSHTRSIDPTRTHLTPHLAAVFALTVIVDDLSQCMVKIVNSVIIGSTIFTFSGIFPSSLVLLLVRKRKAMEQHLNNMDTRAWNRNHIGTQDQSFQSKVITRRPLPKAYFPLPSLGTFFFAPFAVLNYGRNSTV